MILLDANVLLEMLIAGRPRKQLVMEWMEKNREEFCISMLSVHLILHFGLKDGLTIVQLKTFLADYPKVALLPEDYTNALQLLKGTDHEDALQIAQAERTGCERIVTLDKSFAQIYQERLTFTQL